MKTVDRKTLTDIEKAEAQGAENMRQKIYSAGVGLHHDLRKWGKHVRSEGVEDFLALIKKLETT